MFKDYYAILEVSKDASSEEIKKAFKRQALKWHPDRNPGESTTEMMQLLNEAYLILKDPEARNLYNAEFERYKAFKERNRQSKQKEKADNSEKHTSQKTANHENQNRNHRNASDDDYQFFDEKLYRWTKNAEKQAVDLAKQTIEDLKGMVKAGTKGALEGMGYQIAGIILFLTIIGLVRSCNG